MFLGLVVESYVDNMKTFLHKRDLLPIPFSPWLLRWGARILPTWTLSQKWFRTLSYRTWDSRRRVLGLTDKADPKACSSTFPLYPWRFSLTFFCVAYSREAIVHLLQERFSLKVQRQPKTFRSSACIVSRSCNSYSSKCLERLRISAFT